MLNSPFETERLIVFSKIPTPGMVKTRLIPLLGEEGAAEAHQQLSRLTVAWAEQLRDERNVELIVAYTGGSEEELGVAIPGNYTAEEQTSGDLGERMAAAFNKAFSEGASRVVIVGTDCPELDAPRSAEAFERLMDHDLVLGPAADGGYYLIGLSRPCESLFINMPWSERTLYDATMCRAESEGLRCFELRELADVDRPEDWQRWLAMSNNVGNADDGIETGASRGRERDASRAINQLDAICVERPIKLSVLIPVYRDNEALRSCLSCLSDSGDREVIVVLAEHDNKAEAICLKYGVSFLISQKGRAFQLNTAAAKARGEMLLFLHADSRLPSYFQEEIDRILSTPGVAGGAFQLEIDNPLPAYRRIAKWANRRSRWLQLPYGDQGLFVERETFLSLGGFKELPIMEDFEFVRRLSHRGRIAISAKAITTSDRRWQQLGVSRVTLLNQLIVFGYYLGVSPDRLAKWYSRGWPLRGKRKSDI